MSMISIQVEGLRRLADRTYNRYTKKTLREAADTIETLSAKLSGVNLGELVEVVRCKDCKFYKTQYCKIDIHTDIMTINRVHDDDFCSYAERRTDE